MAEKLSDADLVKELRRCLSGWDIAQQAADRLEELNGALREALTNDDYRKLLRSVTEDQGNG